MLSPDGVASSRFVCVFAFVNLPLHHKVQKFSSDTGSPGWSWKKAIKLLECGGFVAFCVFLPFCSCIICICCIRRNFFSTKSRDWLGKTSVK